uniref:F-box domain-containing protein n=1 Tax=Panagrellus redivivus TaxID=6233 RepID=A0A7E4V8V4_PANRE
MLRKLPYGFKKRIITLAPTSVISNFSKVCTFAKKFCFDVIENYDQVLITDSDEVYRLATRDTYVLRIFKFLYQFKYLRLMIDGDYTINPTWKTVLLVDEIIDKNIYISVNDTLILYCISKEKCKEVIPFLGGSYTRLVIYGVCPWTQAKQLIYSDVKEVRIRARIQLHPLRYRKFAKFVVRHCRSYDQR